MVTPPEERGSASAPFGGTDRRQAEPDPRRTRAPPPTAVGPDLTAVGSVSVARCGRCRRRDPCRAGARLCSVFPGDGQTQRRFQATSRRSGPARVGRRPPRRPRRRGIRRPWRAPGDQPCRSGVQADAGARRADAPRRCRSPCRACRRGRPRGRPGGYPADGPRPAAGRADRSADVGGRGGADSMSAVRKTWRICTRSETLQAGRRANTVNLAETRHSRRFPVGRVLLNRQTISSLGSARSDQLTQDRQLAHDNGRSAP